MSLAKVLIKAVLSVMLIAFSAAVHAITPEEAFAASGAVDASKCSVLVIDLSTGKVTNALNERVPLVPASINKAATIAALLKKSGIDYHYETYVYAGGEISNGVLEGDLLTIGSGDPSLGAEVEPKGSNIIREITDALLDAGIDSIAGDVTVDKSIFPGPSTPPSWSSGDLSRAYGTGCHGFNYHRNASGSSSVANPSGVFASELRNAITAAGIKIGNSRHTGSEKNNLLFKHVSPPIDEIMRSCMMRSDNLYAEAFLRTTALLNGKEGSTTAGAAIETEYWRKKHLPMSGVNIVDGSGLSRSNRMTAEFMAAVLKFMADDVDFASFFPLAGQEGTLRTFMKDTPLDSYLALKTGSMNGIQCYAGYKLDDDYAPTHVVVVMINGFKSSRDAVKKAVSNMLLQIFCPSEEVAKN